LLGSVRYRKEKFDTELERIEFLFLQYQAIVASLFTAGKAEETEGIEA